jgi:ketosteroid isomerase-like protein
MSETAAVLFANDAFYIAFRGRDLEAMDDLWAREAPVACIHPGWHALSGREDVMDSWQGILTNPNSPQINCHKARAYLAGDSGFVICYETMGDTVLVATNIFVREAGTWKLAHHQLAFGGSHETQLWSSLVPGGASMKPNWAIEAPRAASERQPSARRRAPGA